MKIILGLVLTVALSVGFGVGLSDRSTGDNVLQNTTVVFGALTPLGSGAVRLSAKDSHVYAASFRGLGLLPETSLVPAYWNITALMDNVSASHWTFPTGLVMEGINATTPAPSKAGDAADLNRGPYRFQIEAFTADKKPYANSAILTINIQKGALSLGTYDDPTFWQTPLLGKGVSGSIWPGDTILLSTGIDRTDKRTVIVNYWFPRTVTFKHADPTRPGGILSLGFSNCTNVLVTGISFTGDSKLVNVPAIIQFGGGSRNMAVRNCNATFSPTTAGRNVAAVQFYGCTNCEVTDVYAYGIDTGIADVQNAYNKDIVITRFRARQFYNNAIWIGNSQNMSFTDCITMAAMRYTGDHIDHLQVADGASPQGLKLTRHLMLKAEGNGAAQGFFGGTAGIYEGYIDNNSTFGSYSGVRGNVLTITKIINEKPLVACTWLRGANFSQLIRVTTALTSRVIGQYIIDQNIAAPVGMIHTAPFGNLTINGLVYAGWNRDDLWLRGLSGQSTIKGVTQSYVNTDMSQVFWTYFMGTIVNGTLNVTSFQSGSPVMTPMYIEMANGTQLIPGGQVQITRQVPGSSTLWALGAKFLNFTFAKPITLRGTSDLPNMPNQGPGLDILGVDVPTLYSGQTMFSSSYIWSSYPIGQPAYSAYLGGPKTKPPSITVDSTMVINNANSTIAAMCFAQGDPQLILQQPYAFWANMSINQVVARYVAALTPRVGGPLTSGTKDYGAFTRTGLWNDGSGKRPY